MSASACAQHPQYALHAVVAPVSVRRDGNAYHASASLHFIVVPKVTPPRTGDPGLNDHLRGYQIISRRVAQSSIGTTEAVGKTAAQARRRLQQAIAQTSADAQKELLREERVYDTVTEDGAAQDQGPQYGFPGGANAKERCPKA